MTVVLGIAVLWVVSGLASFAILSFVNQRPLSDTDRACARIDRALRRQYGARESRFR
jgi:hypothetical protein